MSISSRSSNGLHDGASLDSGGLVDRPAGLQRRITPKQANVTVSPAGPAPLQQIKVRPQHLAPDSRREIAQKAAKARWATWASKKLSDTGKQEARQDESL